MAYRPLIGITTARHIRSNGMVFNTAYYANVKAVDETGGVPVLIPCELQLDTIQSIYQRLDGILLPGGSDVDPSTYDAEAHHATHSIDPARDQIEMQLARWAADDGVPLFAICRGQQVINVALGGTLIQDIPSLIKTELQHMNRIPRDLLVHEVHIVEGSQLRQIMGVKTILVNSIHHQAVDKIANLLTVTAYSPDRLVEGIEMKGHPHYLGVQWHPEDLQHVPQMRNLYSSFVEAAKRHAFSRSIS